MLLLRLLRPFRYYHTLLTNHLPPLIRYRSQSVNDPSVPLALRAVTSTIEDAVCPAVLLTLADAPAALKNAVLVIEAALVVPPQLAGSSVGMVLLKALRRHIVELGVAGAIANIAGKAADARTMVPRKRGLFQLGKATRPDDYVTAGLVSPPAAHRRRAALPTD